MLTGLAKTQITVKKHISPNSIFAFEYSSKKHNPDIKAIDLLLEECAAHKKYVYGIMTTRGINHDSEHFGIRSAGKKRSKN